MKTLKTWLSAIMVMLIVGMMVLPGCKPEPQSEVATSATTSVPTTAKTIVYTNLPPETTTTTTGNIVAGTVAPASGLIMLSKAPALNETVELTYTAVINDEFKGTVSRIWLGFDRFDPAIMYPLFKQADAVEQATANLAKLSAADPIYQATTYDISKQPVSRVSANVVAKEAVTEWAITEMKVAEPYTYSTGVSFPETGEWLITAYWEVDGVKEIRGQFWLTVGETEGHFGWRKNYKPNTGGYQPPDEKKPLAIRLEIDNAPGLNQTATFACTLTSLQDGLQAGVEINLYHMEGTTRKEVPIESVLVSGTVKWKGELKLNAPVQLVFTLRFALEGDWYLAAYPDIPGIVGQIYFNVGKETGTTEWWSEPHIEEQQAPSLEIPAINMEGNDK
ncbi:MAG: hypothetical protein PHE50_03225 [Dehalococcoidales bacterium]|nr:hypothetical protein [Dehalococcoidales bacterium]